ncbi:MAG: OsmC family protein [Campylobacterales bacterium]|nr:OsmC family protein [Campylobacterales bacterium]
MTVTVSHLDAMRFEAQTANGSFVIDCPVISPIEYFLSGLIACSASDMIAIPSNQGKTVRNLSVRGDVVRNGDFPKKFNTLHLVYQFDSDADDTTALRWVMASIETYCSTINTVRQSVEISYDVIHNGVTLRSDEKIISGGGGVAFDMGSIESCPA